MDSVFPIPFLTHPPFSTPFNQHPLFLSSTLSLAQKAVEEVTSSGIADLSPGKGSGGIEQVRFDLVLSAWGWLQNMLADELDASLREHLHWEQQEKANTRHHVEV